MIDATCGSPGSAGFPVRILALILILIGGGFACDPGNGSRVPDVREAELADSVFLAPPVDWGGAFLVCFRFEVTQAEFGVEDINDESADLPAVQMSRPEAEAWASRMGMRLPSDEEWLHLRDAGGSQRAPTGNANTLELGFARPLPVGVFERSRTPLGGYDFDGNVWEWLSTGGPETAQQIGGSFASYGGHSEPPAREANEQDRASDVGFRPVADALPWLRLQIEAAWRDAPAEERQAYAMAVARWRPELRRQLAQNWREQYPDAEDFAAFLENPGP